MKFSHAFFSSSAVFAVGLLCWSFLNANLSLLGRLGLWSLPLGAIAGALIYLGLFLLTRLVWTRLESVRSLMGDLHSMFKEFSWVSIVVISMMAGLGEELLVRGILQTYLVSYLNPFWGIVAASLIFGFMHYHTKTYVLVTFAAGLVFGTAYHLSDSLMLVMIAHAVYDVFAFAVIVKYPTLLKIDQDVNEEHLKA